MSSSESEDETEDQNTENNKFEEFKATILSEPLIPQIKPIKEGILSGINFKEFNINRNKFRVEDKTEEVEYTEKGHTEVIPPKNPLLYGPQIPFPNGNSRSLQNIPQKVVISSDSDDEWVEKDGVEKKKKSKHKKKDKKHKHKKHKKKDK